MHDGDGEQTADLISKHGDTQDQSYSVNEFGETIALGTGGPSEIVQHPTDVPSKIGRYEVRGLLGSGGMGSVYQAYDGSLDREVAIKVPRYTRDVGAIDTFLQEARQLAQLKHANIVTVHDVGVEDSLCFIVSEYLDGKDLNHWLTANPISWQEAAALIAMISDALAAAHSMGIVHRDVKPANVIMTRRGDSTVPVLVDFGMALSQRNQGTGGRRGVIAGTPNYMSPEQARGQGHRIDGRTDIYALGVMLYRMVSGQLPFTGESVSNLLEAIVKDEPQPPRQFVHGLPRELERICLKAMAKELSTRYTTAGDLSSDLYELLREQEKKIQQDYPPSGTTPAPLREATRILIADDHQLSRFKLENDLKKWGHEVTVAEDGQQAWDLYRRGEYSIVITDWMMPKLDGLELVKMIRADQRTDYVYVIMLTAKAEKHDIIAGMGAGADDFLTKPFHRDELQVRLRAGIRITNLNRQLNETNRRLRESQEAANKIQQSYLPTSFPTLGSIQSAWQHSSSGSMGGDMFNIVRLDDRYAGVYMLDVEGSSAPASLLAATLSRVMAPGDDPASILVDTNADSHSKIIAPARVLDLLNQNFGAGDDGTYFTILYGIIDLNTNEFCFSSAGHPPLVHLGGDGSPKMLDIEGYPIAMVPSGHEFTERKITMGSGDRLFLLTDGISDALSEQGEVFGAAQLMDCIGKYRNQPVDELVNGLAAELSQWRGTQAVSDDASVLALEF